MIKKNKNYMNLNKVGMTLLEVNLFLVSFAIIISMFVSFGSNFGVENKYETTQKKLETLVSIILGDRTPSSENRKKFRYISDIGAVPTSTQGLNALKINPFTTTKSMDNNTMLSYGWNGPYQSEDFENYSSVFLDEWGNNILYSSDSSGFTLKSYGADNLEGGTGYNKDIVMSVPQNQYLSKIHGQVLDDKGNLLIGPADIVIHYPDGAGGKTSQTVSIESGNNAVFEFSNISVGTRSFKVHIPDVATSDDVIGPKIKLIDEPNEYVLIKDGELLRPIEIGLSTLNTDTALKWKSEDPSSTDAANSLLNFTHPEGIGQDLSNYYSYAAPKTSSGELINLVVDGCNPGATVSIRGDIDTALSEVTSTCIETVREYPSGHDYEGKKVGQAFFKKIYFLNPSRSVSNPSLATQLDGDRTIYASQDFLGFTNNSEFFTGKRRYCSQYRSQYPPIDKKTFDSSHGMWGQYRGAHWYASVPESDGSTYAHVICDWVQFLNMTYGKGVGPGVKFVLALDLDGTSPLQTSTDGSAHNTNSTSTSLGYQETMMRANVGWHAENSSGPTFDDDFDGNSKKLYGVNIGAGGMATGSRQGLFYIINGKVHDFDMVAPIASLGADLGYATHTTQHYSRTGVLAAYSGSSAEVYNINVVDADVFNGQHTSHGILVGSAGGHFHDITVSGKISSKGTNTGGVFGYFSGTAENINADVEVKTFTGGILTGGSSSGATFTNCHATGKVECSGRCAGFLGSGSGGNFIKSSVSNATITGTSSNSSISAFGGLIGGNGQVTIEQSFAKNISLKGKNIYPFIMGPYHSQINTTTISNSYSDISIDPIEGSVLYGFIGSSGRYGKFDVKNSYLKITDLGTTPKAERSFTNGSGGGWNSQLLAAENNFFLMNKSSTLPFVGSAFTVLGSTANNYHDGATQALYNATGGATEASFYGGTHSIFDAVNDTTGDWLDPNIWTHAAGVLPVLSWE